MVSGGAAAGGAVSAGALAAGATVLYMLSSPEHALSTERGAQALACVPDPTGRGVACSLRF